MHHPLTNWILSAVIAVAIGASCNLDRPQEPTSTTLQDAQASAETEAAIQGRIDHACHGKTGYLDTAYGRVHCPGANRHTATMVAAL